MIRILALNHAALRIGDTQAAKDFYGKLLGLEPAQMPEVNAQSRGAFFEATASRGLSRPTGGLWFSAGNSQVHLIKSEKRDCAINPFGPHLAFEVEDFDETKRTLSEMGIEFLEAPRLSGRQLWIVDPEGNTIELRSDR